MDEKKYGEHVEAHHILQDAIAQVLDMHKVDGMVLGISSTDEKGIASVHQFSIGSSPLRIGLCEVIKTETLLDFQKGHS